MIAKDFLSQAWRIDMRIQEKSEEYERLRGRLEAGRSANYSGMPRGGGGDWTDAVGAVIEMERSIRKEIVELCRIKREVNAAIEAVEELPLRTVLEMRYRNYMPWERIASDLGYELRNVFRLHGKALLKVKVPDSFRGSGESLRQPKHYRRRERDEKHGECLHTEKHGGNVQPRKSGDGPTDVLP